MYTFSSTFVEVTEVLEAILIIEVLDWDSAALTQTFVKPTIKIMGNRSVEVLTLLLYTEPPAEWLASNMKLATYLL